jgi:hypothetical protein
MDLQHCPKQNWVHVPARRILRLQLQTFSPLFRQLARQLSPLEKAQAY